MGKGFNNYMTKKFFHPGSKDNIKRVWMAQQKTDYEKQKQDELLSQYQKEQEMYKNRALLGDEKAKLGLSFMYDAPPGLKKKETEEKETEVKFEWQRKYNAPREQYNKDDETIRDQPFGIEVRNVRCIKCRKWGHVNTDRICPLFNQDLTAEPPQPSTSASSLLEGMQSEGLTLKKSILGKMADGVDTEKFLESEDEDDPEVQFLKSLNPKQRKKLLKKLNKLQSGKKEGKIGKDKKKKKKNHKKRSNVSDEDSDREKKSHRRKGSSSSSEDSGNERGRPEKFRDSLSRHSPERRGHPRRDRSSLDTSQNRRRRSSTSSNSSPQRGSKDKRSQRRDSRRSTSRDHSPDLRNRQRRSRSSSFEEKNDRDRLKRSNEGCRRGHNEGGKRRSRSPAYKNIQRNRGGDQERRRRSRSSSSSSERDGRSYTGHQRNAAMSSEQRQRLHRRSISQERSRRDSHNVRQRRSNSRERNERSRSRDRRRR
ncbi:corepressor interacting with RBPJ 1-like [Saccostrea echinata]|uniref:corepressor interacting with RBPJ 1-like n=1 Tax=Saccostrea echinata TaxID=191078 RepID=UPI002A7F8205|nr:corepressor interacting with RBPJ 1-like [Saccostrea echinata]